MTQQFSRELLRGKAPNSPCTLWRQVPVPSEMRIGHLWMELCSPPAGRRGCIFFSGELNSSREESFLSKFDKNVGGERGEGLETHRPWFAAWLTHRFSA